MSDSAMVISKSLVPASKGLAYSNLSHTFQLKTLTPKWTPESRKVMDTQTKIWNPLQNHQYITPRTFNTPKNQLGGSTKQSKPSLKANILINILSLRSPPGSLSWMKIDKVLEYKIGWQPVCIKTSHHC